MPHSRLDRIIERQRWIERPADWFQRLVGATYRALGPIGRWLKDFMHGRWLGHALHPVLTDIPVGAWAIALVLDVVSQLGHPTWAPAADAAVAVGLLGAVGAALSGSTDFSATYGAERRAGCMHGLLMTVTTALFAVSLTIRLIGASRGLAIVLAFIGYAVLSCGAYIGGHLVFGFGTMVNRNAFSDISAKPRDVGSSSDFTEGVLKRVDVGGTPVAAIRLGGRICAIGAVCSHAGGPLDEGSVEGTRVTCPWHGSQFDVCSGRPLHGPATFAQPRFRVMETDGRVSMTLTR